MVADSKGGLILRERELEKILVDEVRKAKGRAYKWTSPGNDGVPDRIVIMPGEVPVFLELKTDKGKLSSLQQVQINKLRCMGQFVVVSYGAQGLIEFFKVIGIPDAAQRLERRRSV